MTSYSELEKVKNQIEEAKKCIKSKFLMNINFIEIKEGEDFYVCNDIKNILRKMKVKNKDKDKKNKNKDNNDNQIISSQIDTNQEKNSEDNDNDVIFFKNNSKKAQSPKKG